MYRVKVRIGEQPLFLGLIITLKKPLSQKSI